MAPCTEALEATMREKGRIARIEAAACASRGDRLWSAHWAAVAATWVSAANLLHEDAVRSMEVGA